MRKYLLAACAVTCIFGVSPPAPAESVDAQVRTVGTMSPKITALLTEFPAGGPWLRAAIARAVEADPSLADDAISVAGIANALQAQAIRLGLADAANFFVNSGSASAGEAARGILAALGTGNPDAGASLLQAPMQGVPGFSKAGAAATTTTGCISPSRPGC